MTDRDLLGALLAGRLPRSMRGVGLPRVRSGAFPVSFEVDDEGYPSENAVEAIRLIAAVDAARWIREVFVPEYGAMPYGGVEVSPDTDLGRAEIQVRCWTNGWSGNEDIIYAMLGNFWIKQYLESQRRGGSYIFVVPALDAPQGGGGDG